MADESEHACDTMELAAPKIPAPNISSIKNKHRRQKMYKDLMQEKRKVS